MTTEDATPPLDLTTQATDFKALEAELLLPTYARWPITLVEGRGVHVTDDTGRTYLDLYGGHCVASTGHCHPRIVRAITEAAGRLLFYSTVAHHPVRAEAARLLTRHAPRGLDRVFFCNSGAEANESAMKIARKATKRDVIVSFCGGFHGRTQAALSSTTHEYHRGAGPLVPGHEILPWASTEAVERIDETVAAVILEPIQSMAGVREAPHDWLAALREACDSAGAALIFDEVQTGMGRTGTFYSHRWAGVVPDAITLAKGVASGFPAGVALVSNDLSRRLEVGDQGSTFGGGPVASAAIAETVRVVEDEGLPHNATRVGTHIRERLADRRRVVETRGRGLLIGIVLDAPDGRATAATFREAGVLLGTSDDPSVLRLMPPLTLQETDLDPFWEAVGTILA